MIDSQARALTAAHAALDKQADDVLIMDLRTLSTVTEFFVLGTAESSRQLDAIREHVEDRLAGQGAPVRHIEGSMSSGASAGGSSGELRWVLMDFGEIVVHLMDPRTRAFYRLEDLWRDAPRLPLDAHPSSL